MKLKTFSLLILFTSLLMQVRAQSLSLQQTSTSDPLLNGAEITLSSPSVEDEIELHLFLRNNGEHPVDVKVKKIYLSIIDNSGNHFCWGEACLPPTQFESPRSENINPGEITDSLFFSAHYLPYGNSGTSTIMYVFFDEDNPIDSIGVIVNYAAGETGLPNHILENLFISDPYPNPAFEYFQFDYSIPREAGMATLTIYNLTGSEIVAKNFYPGNGKISIRTTNLLRGYYVWEFDIDKQSVRSGKIAIVR